MEILRRYRFLIIVCGLALLAGLWEYFRPKQVESRSQMSGDRHVYSKVFPGSPNAQFDFGVERFQKKEYAEALHHFEAALASGVKTNEDLFWYYALTLLYLKQETPAIDRAVAQWRRNAPHSAEHYDPYWEYPCRLLNEGSEDAEIDRAVAQWLLKSPDPDSRLPDPHWVYAVRLVAGKSTPAEIDAAVAQWRRHSPHSKHPDPRGPSRQ